MTLLGFFLVLGTLLGSYAMHILPIFENLFESAKADLEIAELGESWTMRIDRLDTISAALKALEIACANPSTRVAAMSGAKILEVEARIKKLQLESSWLLSKGRGLLSHQSFITRSSGPCLNAESSVLGHNVSEFLVEFSLWRGGKEIAGLRIERQPRVHWTYAINERIYPCRWKSSHWPC